MQSNQRRRKNEGKNNGANLKELSENKLEIEKILNIYLEKLLLLNKKDIYYNGYNTNTKILTTNNVLEYNRFDYENEYKVFKLQNNGMTKRL